ncbi:hypothetical protein [Streptomyces qinzhouensis]|uniref:Uncharacterized protein n=1 Tax=Streptomyces qinzhouensis TaxID=2599401 RepID=A0A5B8JGJ5_9ACTN|nr:hypothetical protein [Streptomyces qinzhouensis]QDY78981.1 hypothetical protein FQU76_23425 [Streptomyces qinzhouensis]
MNATAVGALLLVRAEPSAVRSPAQLLREPQLLVPAGADWSALVPEGAAWQDGEPVDRVVAGWAVALAVAVGVGRPVLALWWDADRVGFTLASGFRRPVGYVWLTDGTPAGEDEAMSTFAARLGLDPVIDVQALAPLTRENREIDGADRLRGLVAVLSRAGLELPPGLAPGRAPAELYAVAEALDAQTVEWAGWRDAVRTELHAVEESFDHWLREPRERKGLRALGAAQLAVGIPLAVWGLRRRSLTGPGGGGWAVAGAVLAAQGALLLAYERRRLHEE